MKDGSTVMGGASQQAKQGRPSRFTAADRLMAISPMLQWNRSRERGPKAPSLTRIAYQIATEHGVSSGTVWIWYRKFKEGGYSALVHSRRDRGCLRYIANHPEIEMMIRARMSPGRSAFAIWKALRLVLGSAAPIYQTVLRYMKAQHKEAARKSSAPRSAEATVTG